MISFIAKIIVALNNNSRPGEMASAIAFGFWLALIPGGNLLWIFLFIIAFLLKHNTGAFLFSLAIFRLLAPFFDHILDNAGFFVLQLPVLQGFYTDLYNIPLVPYSNFNNSIVMGGFLLGLISWLPLFLLFLFLVKLYRKKVAPKVADSRIVKAMKKVPLLSKIIKAVSRGVSS
jgi:uncharacterized protein (TIGR03546 family)